MVAPVLGQCKGSVEVAEVLSAEAEAVVEAWEHVGTVRRSLQRHNSSLVAVL